MKPTLGDVLSAISARVAGNLLPALPAGYLQSDAMVLALLLAGAAEEQERGADVRKADIEEMRAIFDAARQHLEPGRLRDRVAAAGDDRPASLRIADLDACHDRMRRVLVELHEAVESASEERSREIEASIWKHLRASVGRHAMSTNPF